MKPISFNKKAGYLIVALGMVVTGILEAQVTTSPPNYTVTTPGNNFEFDVNGQSSGQPAQDANVDDSLNFSLPAGATYIFKMSTASIHPVDICTNSVTSAKYTGASAQAVSSGTVTVTIPATNYPPTLYYICNIHTFYGKITITPPPTPAANNHHQNHGDNQYRPHFHGRNQHHPDDTAIQLKFGERRMVAGSKLYE